jgi:Two component regulator propeller
MQNSYFFRNSFFSLLFVLVATGFCFGQNGYPLGSWRVHLPYKQGKFVTGSSTSIWCASDFGLFRLNRADKSVDRITKVEGLSDLSFSALAYNAAEDVLVIGYKTGNIDLVYNGQIVNLPDIRRSTIIGSKTINNITFSGSIAYLSCGFGIVVLDLDRVEVKDTYLLGNNGTYLEVFDVELDAAQIYAGTAQGLYYAQTSNPFLSSFTSWTRYSFLPVFKFTALGVVGGEVIANYRVASTGLTDVLLHIDPVSLAWDTVPGYGGGHFISDIDVLNNELFLADIYSVNVHTPGPQFTQVRSYFNAASGPTFPNGIFVDQQHPWIADNNRSLIEMANVFDGYVYAPNGPSSVDVFTMDVSQGNLLVVSGGRDDAWNNIYSREGASVLRSGLWTPYGGAQLPQLTDSTYDLISCAIDPSNPNHYFLGSWGEGLVEMNNGAVTTIYDQNNSPLQSRPAYPWCGISGLEYDADQNLWMVNSHVPQCLKVRKPNGQWQAFDFSGLVPGETVVATLMITEAGQKWMILPRGGGVLVFDDKGTLATTSDDRKRKLGFTPGIGNIPGNDVNCLTEDEDGEIWVGTNDGVGVFYSPENVFNTSGFDCQRILLDQDGTLQELLKGQEVTAIAVDGANRKWIATRGGGVFLMSADGTQEVRHFTATNSPLLSDNVVALAIDPISGEVFFSTDKGLISYNSDAIAGGEKNEGVLAYPNPVRPEYRGPIAIRGLVKDADVKITDIQGNVVFKTTALGGQAIWDGNNFSGQRAATGVYLVFITNEDGSETAITKILFVN